MIGKRTILKWAGIVLGGLVALVVAFLGAQLFLYEESMAKVYEVPLPKIAASTDPVVITRGKHLAESVAGCATTDCHGADLGGGKVMEAGPLGTIVAPNITSGGVGGYSDSELARLVLHGLDREGRSVRFMPSQDIGWLPDDEVGAIISWVRSMPPINRPSGKLELGLLAKILDRFDMLILDVARRIDHQRRPEVPKPAATAEYGAFLARSCSGCHGLHFGGGRIPGTPSSFAVPANLTPHQTGLKEWSYADFDKFLKSGVKRDGRKVDAFMPVEAVSKMDDVEKGALWAYLKNLPPVPFGSR